MESIQWLMSFVLFAMLIPGTQANTDYSTLESLCIAILVLFIIWVIVIIILICVCKNYINKAAYVNESEVSASGHTNVAYIRDSEPVSYRRKSTPRVHPSPQQSRPQFFSIACQTDPCYLDPLGPNVAVQTGDESHHNEPVYDNLH